jgi:hypothetical protein
MTKIFDLPYCTNDLRHYLKPLSTTNELFRLKQYFFYQKNLAINLINYQRLLTSKYNHKLYIDKNLFENFRLSSIRSNINVFIINKKRFNRILNSSNTQQININKQQRNSPLTFKTSVSSIDHTETQIKNINTTIIKLNTCSTLIATGHGIAMNMFSLINNDLEQWNHGLIHEDISLSKKCNKILNQRKIPIVPDKISQK